MLTKILFTVLVVLVVAVVFRHKNSQRPAPVAAPRDPGAGALSAQKIIYIVIGILIALSVLFYGLKWMDDNSIINITVTSAGEELIYSARKKDLVGRSFQTLDGRLVTLGDADRMEISDAD